MPDTGRLYWSEPLATAYAMAIMAPRKGGDFLFAGGHNGRSVGLKLDPAKPAVTKVWKGSRDLGLAPVSGTPFVEDGIAYGIDGDSVLRATRVAKGKQMLLHFFNGITGTLPYTNGIADLVSFLEVGCRLLTT